MFQPMEISLPYIKEENNLDSFIQLAPAVLEQQGLIV